MLYTNATRCFPIIDEQGLTRAIVLLQPGREFESTQLARRVVVAVSFALGEKVDDWSSMDIDAARAKIAHRFKGNPLGLQARLNGILEVADRDIPLVLVAVYRGRESECQAIANDVVHAVDRFSDHKLDVRAYEI
jgi:hypothetical protein